MPYRKHLINSNGTIKYALELLSSVGLDTILFAINENKQLIGSITDGDIRRGLLKGLSIENPIAEIINQNPKFIRKENYSIDEIKNLRNNNYIVIPVLDKNDVVINIINFRVY